MSEEWKDGYKQGIRDGIEIEKNRRRDWTVPPQSPVSVDYGEQKCKVCGMSFTDDLGRIKVMGYVCPHDKCPGKITC
jgi:hypothetical protein